MEGSVIAIAGGSCTGKGFLCSHLKERLRPLECRILPMDDYYRDLSGIPAHERGACNFDSPDSIDHQLFLDHLRTLLGGGSVRLPAYDFATHTRAADSGRILSGGGLIVIEGIFTLFWEEIRSLASLKVYIDLNTADCLERRISRDIRERGRTRESVERQFRQTVLPMYAKYVRPTQTHADLIVDGSCRIEDSVEMVLEASKGMKIPGLDRLARYDSNQK